MKYAVINERWFRVFKPSPSAKMRLFCFPYGGSGPSVFRDWADHFSDDIEVIGVLYPGRESRTTEPLTPDIKQMAEAMLPTILQYLDKPFAFFGHSMGALISFELTRLLSAECSSLPEHLFVSAADAPHVVKSDPIHHLPEEEFLQALIGLNGMPREVLENTEFLEYVLPIIRSDFSACANYRYSEGPLVSCPVTAYGGSNDPRVDPQYVEQWCQYAGARFQVKMFAGDHFFMTSHQREMISAIHQELCTWDTPVLVSN